MRADTRLCLAKSPMVNMAPPGLGPDTVSGSSPAAGPAPCSTRSRVPLRRSVVELGEPAGEEISLNRVAREHQGLVVGEPGVVRAVQAAQELGASRGQVVVPGELRVGR